MSRRLKFLLVGLGVIVLNALIQCLLVIPSPIPGKQTLLFVLLALASTVVYIWYLTVIVSLKTAPSTATGIADTVRAFRPRFVRFLLWLIGFSIVFTIGFFLRIVPGLVILAIAPMVVLAVADGSPNPIRQNFVAIKSHFWGWLWRILLSGLLCFVAWLSAGLFMFLWVGAVGAFAAWIVVGVITWLLTDLWLRNLRRVPGNNAVDAAPDDSKSTPAPVSA